jgi:hypothetical protein
LKIKCPILDWVVTHCLPGAFSARESGVAGHQTDAFHFIRPLFVVVGAVAGLAEFVLPQVYHLVDNGLHQLKGFVGNEK